MDFTILILFPKHRRKSSHAKNHYKKRSLVFTWPSALAVANLFPSGENLTQFTNRVWSCRKKSKNQHTK